MQAALSIAECGYHVHLVEKTDALGGQARHIHWTWKRERVQPFLEEMMEKVQRHPSITVHLRSKVTYASGFVGNFRSTITHTVGRREAVTLDHGVVVLATGATAYRPSEYLYGEHPNIMLWHELDERIANRDPLITEGRCGVFIQCVGSREPERAYCSRICCAHSVRSALQIKELNPDMEVYILYRDLRTYGLVEQIYYEALKEGILFIRYDLENKPKVSVGKDYGLELQVMDHILQRPVMMRPDFINLATAVEPQGHEELSKNLKVPLNEDGFFLEAHAKLRPVDFATDGIFVCGLAHYPKSIEESLAQAMAAAARSVCVLARGEWVTSGLVASVDPQTCVGCQGCVDVCPYVAITYLEERHVCEVNAALCKGCGSCAAACPSGSTRLAGFTREQLNTQIAAALL
jgi:heterodisulfide reductase subunit A